MIGDLCIGCGGPTPCPNEAAEYEAVQKLIDAQRCPECQKWPLHGYVLAPNGETVLCPLSPADPDELAAARGDYNVFVHPGFSHSRRDPPRILPGEEEARKVRLRTLSSRLFAKKQHHDITTTEKVNQ